MRTFLTVAFLVLSGCMPKHELAGDIARKAGDRATAVREYEAAMAQTPIMDFEFGRAQKKRRKLVEGEWSPRVDAVIAEPVGTERTIHLMEIRRQARDGRTTLAMAKRIDTELASALTIERLKAYETKDVYARLSTLTELYDAARVNRAPQETFDAISAAAEATATLGLPSPRAFDEIDRLLMTRRELRERNFPAAVDAMFDVEVRKFSALQMEPVRDGNAESMLPVAVASADLAYRFGAPPEIIAMLEARVESMAPFYVARADRGAAKHDYIATWDQLGQDGKSFADRSAVVARVSSLSAEAVAWYTSQAAALPAGYRHLLQSSLAATLGGASADVERRALSADFATSIAFKPEISGCAANSAFSGALSTGTKPLPLRVNVSNCSSSAPVAQRSASFAYVADETYFVDEEVQVGTRLETYQSGSHDEQCSKSSSLDGYSWVGVCSVPDYATRQVPVFEVRPVEHHRDTQKFVDYVITTYTIEASYGGTASVTWEDGTTLDVPFEHHSSQTRESWHFDVPGRLSTDAHTTHDQPPPGSSFSDKALLADQARASGSDASAEMLSKIIALRARLSRADGDRAAAAGDAAAAGEAYLRSALIRPPAEDAAVSWLTAATGVDRDRSMALLLGFVRTVPGGRGIPPKKAYERVAPVAEGDSYQRDVADLELEVGSVTTETYHKGIMPPNEIVSFHVGILPIDIGKIGDRVGATLGLEGYYGVLGLFGRYGPALFDQLGFRASYGMSTAKQREFANGKEEGPLAFTAAVGYRLAPGVRLHHVGIFAGLYAGYQHVTDGGTVAYGWHVEPTVHLTFRLFHTKNLTIDASGFWTPFPTVNREDKLSLSFPVKQVVDIKLFGSRMVLPAKRRPDSGEGWESLGRLPVYIGGVQVGMRL